MAQERSFNSIRLATDIDGEIAPGCIFNDTYYINQPLVVDIHVDEGYVDLHDGEDIWRSRIEHLIIEGKPVTENITAEQLEQLLLPYSTENDSGDIKWSEVGGNVFGNADLTKYFIFGNSAWSTQNNNDLKNLYKEIILLNRDALPNEPMFLRGQATIRAYGAHFADLDRNSIGISVYGPQTKEVGYLPQIDLRAKSGAHIILKPASLLLHDAEGNELLIEATSTFGSPQSVYDNTENTETIERSISPNTAKVGFHCKLNILQLNGPYPTKEAIPQPYNASSLYLVGTASPYSLYAFVENNLVLLGDTDIDLGDYYTKAETNNILDVNYYNKTAIDTRFGQYYNKTQTNSIISTAIADALGDLDVKHDGTLTGDGTTSSVLSVASPYDPSAVTVRQLVPGTGIDISSSNGVWTISAASSGGGLTVVAHNETLSGDGTENYPLAVKDPFSQDIMN